MKKEIAKMNRVIKSFKMVAYSHFPKLRIIEFVNMEDFVEWLQVSHLKSK